MFNPSIIPIVLYCGPPRESQLSVTSEKSVPNIKVIIALCDGLVTGDLSLILPSWLTFAKWYIPFLHNIWQAYIHEESSTEENITSYIS